MPYYIEDNRFNQNDTLSLLFVCLAFLWAPLNVWYLPIDSAARIPFFLLIYGIALERRALFRTSITMPTKLYSFIAVYMVLNGFFAGSAEMFPKAGNWLIVCHIIGPFVALLLITTCARKDFNKTISILTYGLILYCLMGIHNSTLDEKGRLNAEINANEMAINGAILTGLIILQVLRGVMHKWKLSFILLPLVLIILTGSRMAFGMIFIMIVVAILINTDFSKSSTVILAVILMGLAIWGIDYILSNTLLGERLLHTTQDAENIKLQSTGTILDYYGDRGFQYYYSWPYFLDNPIFGIGFHKWQMYSPSGHVCHSEFMVQYLEGGLISFIPWLMFWYYLCKPLNFVRKYIDGIEKTTVILLLTILAALLYAATVLWSYNIYCVFIIYALAIAYPRNLGYEE